MNDPKQVMCQEHGLAPWGIVCFHLVTGESRKWRPAPHGSGPGCENDWLCPECASKSELADHHSLNLLCVQCIRALRQKYDPTVKECMPAPGSQVSEE
jgi:hypothetical protein